MLISFGHVIAPAVHDQVLRLVRRLTGMPGVRNLNPAYASVLVSFNPLETDTDSLATSIREVAGAKVEEPLPEPRLVEVPVKYGGEAGPDLEEVAKLHGIPAAEVIALHSSAEYLVYFLGFSPGFPYLGGMPESLATPRLARPRRLVPAGSVAIGGSQTGIYPVASPGGWRIIGRTPLELFNPDRNPPVLLEMGDRLRFVPL